MRDLYTDFFFPEVYLIPYKTQRFFSGAYTVLNFCFCGTSTFRFALLAKVCMLKHGLYTHLVIFFSSGYCSTVFLPEVSYVSSGMLRNLLNLRSFCF